MKTRKEIDSLGEIEMPENVLYGAQTMRARQNFPISGWRLPVRFIRSLALIKLASAKVNNKLGKLDSTLADLIQQASGEILNGEMDEQFVVDVFQSGSGTSTNMNANEVIANRAIQITGGKIGSKEPVHPNDHVNMGQSSNDIIPTALQISVVMSINEELKPALKTLSESLKNKSTEFESVIKIGRTHLMDATPISMGQVFSGYEAQVTKSIDRLNDCVRGLRELPIGGTAVGTGINTHADFGKMVAEEISRHTEIEFIETSNHFAAQSTMDSIVETAAILKTIAISIGKIANDIRFLGSGPRCGIGELILPAIQPGSSIMPGKVNPVIPEAVLQVSAYVVGVDASISHAAATLSNFELSTACPFTAYQMLESIRILSNVSGVFADKCIDGLEVNEVRCEEMIERSLAMCTSLVEIIGYDKAAEIAKEAYKTGKTVREIAYDWGVAERDVIDQALDPKSMI